jgi:hypothetical protein
MPQVGFEPTIPTSKRAKTAQLQNRRTRKYRKTRSKMGGHILLTSEISQ